MFTRKLKRVELEIDGLKDVEDVDYVDASFIHIRMAAHNVQCSAYYVK